MTGSGGAAPTAAAAATPAGTVRPATLAGSWYPGSPALLLATARSLMRQASAAPMPIGRPVALAVPHAGWAYSGAVAAAAFRILRPGSFTRVVVMAPSHHAAFAGYALEDAAAYRTPLGETPLARAALGDLEAPGLARVVPGATGPEHAVEIELPFLQAALGPFTLVPILAGRVDAAAEKAFAEKLARLDDGRTLFVFSSDFTHYGPRFGYTPFGPTSGARARIRELDDAAIGLLGRLDAEGWRSFVREKNATICGEAGLVTMVELLRRIAPRAQATLLAHWASGEMPGPGDDSSVDYASLAYARGEGSVGEPLNVPPRVAAAAAGDAPVTDAVGRALVRVARGALDAELRGDTAPLDAALRELPGGSGSLPLQAVFVTLRRKDPAAIARLGDLRGCIGQVVPTDPLDLAVVRSALDAALADPRFPRVEARELPGLSVEVTVLSPIVPIRSWKEIRIGTHGIVLEKGAHRALFLPQVAREQGWTVEETLDALAQKAGLSRGDWRSGATFSVFTGQVFPEETARAAPLPKR